MQSERGLYGKYVVFDATTEQMVTDFAFVLKPESDPVAWDVLAIYAEETPNVHLATDLFLWLDGHPRPKDPPSPTTSEDRSEAQRVDGRTEDGRSESQRGSGQ